MSGIHDKRSAKAIQLKESLEEIEASNKGLHNDVYRYMAKLMTEDLCKVWQTVSEEQCNQPYTGLDGLYGVVAVLQAPDGRHLSSRQCRTSDSLL